MLMLNIMVIFAMTTRQQVQDVTVLLDAQTVALLSGVVIPLLVGVLAKADASDGLKAVLNALLSALAGTIAAFSQDGFFQSDLRTIVLSILSTWVVSVASYYGVFKPTGVAGTVAAATSGFGIGSPPALETGDKGAEDPPGAGDHRRA